MLAECRQRLHMQVSIQRDVMAEADKMAVGWQVVMEIIRLMIGHCDRLRHRSLYPIGDHPMADGGHGRCQMRTDEGISTDYNATFKIHNFELKAKS